MTSALDTARELTNDLMQARKDLKTNISYYESEERPQAIGLAVPPEMRSLLANVGWGRMYVGSIEERLDIEGFRMAGADTADDRLWKWWQVNGMDEKSSFAHNEVLIHGRAYIVLSHPDPKDKTVPQDVPRITVESPVNMWADIHPLTGKVTKAVLVRKLKDDAADFDFLTLYLPDDTIGYQRAQDGWKVVFHVKHKLGVVPVVPIVNRARLTDTYGSSEIKKELRSCIDAASRTMMNMQATAELMAIPQRILFGVDPEKVNDNPNNTAKTFSAYMARILAFDDADAKAHQFTAAELRNFTEVMDQIAKLAASYTGLPMGFFSLSSDNPASADAIRESEKRLVKKAERKQRIFGAAWEEAMRIALLIMDKSIPEDAHQMEVVWRDPATPTFAAKADAVVKLATAMTPDGRPLVPVERARIDLGYSEAERTQMEKWDSVSPTKALAGLLSKPGSPQFSDNPNPEDAEEP